MTANICDIGFKMQCVKSKSYKGDLGAQRCMCVWKAGMGIIQYRDDSINKGVWMCLCVVCVIQSSVVWSYK